ncbi:hypothetical protein F5148DRAFT_795984 [Russula earlei]|uniref:Uncharacterized protein n=1 Tax=Russula earlei TaxID=71964 RepID=A0ACC0UC05_9AGAM|nr:hypothetical protein F5148DRAFT_795984 [Russula earlei]
MRCRTDARLLLFMFTLPLRTRSDSGVLPRDSTFPFPPLFSPPTQRRSHPLPPGPRTAPWPQPSIIRSLQLPRFCLACLCSHLRQDNQLPPTYSLQLRRTGHRDYPLRPPQVLTPPFHLALCRLLRSAPKESPSGVGCSARPRFGQYTGTQTKMSDRTLSLRRIAKYIHTGDEPFPPSSKSILRAVARKPAPRTHARGRTHLLQKNLAQTSRITNWP